MSASKHTRPPRRNLSPRSVKTWKDAHSAFVHSVDAHSLPTENLPPPTQPPVPAIAQRYSGNVPASGDGLD